MRPGAQRQAITLFGETIEPVGDTLRFMRCSPLRCHPIADFLTLRCDKLHSRRGKSRQREPQCFSAALGSRKRRLRAQGHESLSCLSGRALWQCLYPASECVRLRIIPLWPKAVLVVAARHMSHVLPLTPIQLHSNYKLTYYVVRLMRPAYVYALKDPRTNRVRYVGSTIQKPHRRFQKHLVIAAQGLNTTHKYNWIRELLQCGLRPELAVLEITTTARVYEREQRWIAHYRSDALTNHTDAGPGIRGMKHRPETIERMKRAAAGRKPSDECRRAAQEACRGRKRSEESRRKQSQSTRGRPQNPEHVRKRAASRRGKKFTPEHIKHLSEAHRRKPSPDQPSLF